MAETAEAAPCRREVVGEELPDGLGPYPLIAQLGLRQAWDLATGEGVTVAVVDSGVDARHPDLAASVRRGSEFALVADERGFTRASPEPAQDCEGHGTAVAGLIAARRAEGDRMAGVAPGAAVYPVRIADGVEQATAALLAAALDDAVEAGAQVVNLSLAVPTDYPELREAVARAVAADVLLVAAAGNEGNQGAAGGRMYPAAYDGVLAVGGVGEDGQPLDSSNSGPWVDLAAYGQELAVAAPGGSGYRVESGTSVAAAQVSGAAALVRSRFPELPAAEVAARLTAAATPVGGGPNDRTGAGLVDPFGALTLLAEPGRPGGPALPGHIPVQALPEEEPPLSPAAATALAWSGGLLLAVLLGLLGAPAVRRAARRDWRAGPGPADAAPTPAARPTAPPALDWLAGADPGRSPERKR
ncbi:S8 family serine peptidase [Streptomyces sp. DSM 44917]|uniref:S8 family serine peptidase n=1 Tax=Streptomyces boetiae TaxID=3075541 RepID=A0ABU2L2Q1_9ACTN|nr:S8 family serine peptidase [Streptomyces sp. DSM 44917]MDT0305681.1 S8 family serine peptidase [Streptomyces sp. DSM 44917]